MCLYIFHLSPHMLEFILSVFCFCPLTICLGELSLSLYIKLLHSFKWLYDILLNDIIYVCNWSPNERALRLFPVFSYIKNCLPEQSCAQVISHMYIPRRVELLLLLAVSEVSSSYPAGSRGRSHAVRAQGVPVGVSALHTRASLIARGAERFVLYTGSGRRNACVTMVGRVIMWV